MKILVTGGAGFIGSAVVRHLINQTNHDVINVDALTYAGNLASLGEVLSSNRHVFEHKNICDAADVGRIFREYQPEAVIHLAAESHVDRSINGPLTFLRTNLMGTGVLLEAARTYWELLPPSQKAAFRFLHVSTDEVYGDLVDLTTLFTETTPYAPSSPYSASKAGSDHLVRAWHRTFGLPTLITNCSNNYGPYHFPEKLIPLMIRNALAGKPLPVYGDGQQIRDWLYVDDHVHGLLKVLEGGNVGATYNISGRNEYTNFAVVEAICDLLDLLAPQRRPAGASHYRDLIVFTQDRPGHDRRYAVDASKIQRELGWMPKETFESGLRKTVQWYLDNQAWIDNVTSGAYRNSAAAKVECNQDRAFHG